MNYKLIKARNLGSGDAMISVFLADSRKELRKLALAPMGYGSERIFTKCGNTWYNGLPREGGEYKGWRDLDGMFLNETENTI